MPAMLHAAIRAARGTLLFRTAQEARALWDHVTRRLGARLHALGLMPDHVHSGLPGRAAWRDFQQALRAYAMQRNRARGESGPVFEHGAQPVVVDGVDRIRRLRRYIHLNPCRAGLVDDPLAWDFTTHRDALGLAIPAACLRVDDEENFHAYVSGDPSVRPAGTPLPRGTADPGRTPALAELIAAVAALTRSTAASLPRDRAARNLLILAAQHLGERRVAEVADYLGVHPGTVRRHQGPFDPRVTTVARVLGDRRFSALEDGDLRRLPSWRRYRHLR